MNQRSPVSMFLFTGILLVRRFLYTFSGLPVYLIAVQLLDDIGAGIFRVVSVLTAAVVFFAFLTHLPETKTMQAALRS